MKVIASRLFSGFAGFFNDGPWRAKSVWAALAAVLAGTGLWFSDIQDNPPSHLADLAVTNATGITVPSTPAVATETHWNWQKPLPGYVRGCASYVAGFCLGWFFRKLIRLIFIAMALAVALLALGRFAGYDTTHAQSEVKRGGERARQQVTVMADDFKRLLPSAVGGGAGAIFGFRRRRKVLADKTEA